MRREVPVINFRFFVKAVWLKFKGKHKYFPGNFKKDRKKSKPPKIPPFPRQNPICRPLYLIKATILMHICPKKQRKERALPGSINLISLPRRFQHVRTISHDRAPRFAGLRQKGCRSWSFGRERHNSSRNSLYTLSP